MKKTLLLLSAILLPLLANAEDICIDGICYDFCGSKATVAGAADKKTKSVVIPESVTYNGKKYGVTCIGSEAFKDCSELTSVKIPSSVKAIKGCAFFGCYGLTSVKIPDGVTSIEVGAFCGCSGLTSVTIPNSVTNISMVAFAGCSSLTSIKISNSMKIIGKGVFGGCSSLASVTIPQNVISIGYNAFHKTAWYDNQPDGLVYAGKVAYKYKGEMPEGTQIVIKEGTRGIAQGAFEYCNGLTSVSIPGSVTCIDTLAFYGCNGLTSVKIPNGVTIIGNGAFRACRGLTSVSIPGSVTCVEAGAFRECSGLTDVFFLNENILAGVDLSAFLDSPIESATLHVPGGSVESYRTTEPWSDFGKIVALTKDEIRKLKANK